MSTIDEEFAGKFIDKTWSVESKTLMSDIKEALQTANSTGRTTKVSFEMTFTVDEESRQITPKLKFGGAVAKRTKSAASFSLRHDGQLTFDDVKSPLAEAEETGDHAHA